MNDRDPGRERLVVAIDGPSGSGKSTVSRAVAAALGLRFLDTGAMYRAVTWAALDRSIDLGDSEAVAALARALHLEIGQDPQAPSIAVDGVDVSRQIRESRISEAVSAVATNLGVRAELVRRQRDLVRAGGVVAEGRDITTVVAPEADVRLLLTATEQARLTRRARELHGRADEAALAATHAQVVHRDARDSTVAEFRSASTGVVELDSSALTLDETVDAVLDLVARRTGVQPVTKLDSGVRGASAR